MFAATRARITRFLTRALITRAASEETLITRAVYEWANAVRGNMISEIVYDFRSEPSIQEGSGRAPNKTSEIVYDFRSEPSIQEGSGRAPNKTSETKFVYAIGPESSIQEGSGSALKRSSELIVRKTPNELKWPFFHSGSKQEDAVSPDVLLMRSHGEDVVNCTLDLLKAERTIVWIGIPGVVSNICEWCQQTRCYLFGLLFFTH
jgi:hypothetical protein